jgi:ABC-2 type transport system permease protein
MATIVNEIRATYAFMERNANLVKRYWSWELVWITYSIANSLSVSFIGLGMEKIGGASAANGRYLVLYLVVGTLVWRYLSLIFYWITDVIGMERWEGTIEYTLMAPIRRITHMAGQTLWAVIYSMFSTGIILVVSVAIFQIDLSHANLLGGMVMLLAGSLSFIGVGDG